MKPRLLSKTPSELRGIASECSLPSYAASQLAKWMYSRRVLDPSLMTDVSKAGREALCEKYDGGALVYSKVQTSSDGTRKYLFPVRCTHRKGLSLSDGMPDSELEESFIEAVMIPDGERKTLCISSQAGCRMNCSFCMTGRGGFHGNLSASDILAQVYGVDEGADLTNVVFMGMGEPLDNWENVKRAIEVMTAPWGFAWSPKRITLSSIGVIPALEEFLRETSCHLAISLHSPFDEERLSLMPVQKAYPIKDVVSLLRKSDFGLQRRLSFEYTMFSGVNDDKRHADALLNLLKGLDCRVNLIRFHRIPGSPYHPSADMVMEAFRDRLSRHGIISTIRASRGEDISAACGMLAGEHKTDGQ